MKEIMQYVSTTITVLSLVVIVYGVVVEFAAFLRNEIRRDDTAGIKRVRAGFIGYLLLGLEFLIAADIIRTIIDPTYEELIVLAGIVILRTVLSVFLNKEAKDLKI